MDNVDNRKKKALEALELSHGIVSTACLSADIPRSTFYKWCTEDLEFKANVEAINETAIDFVESKLFEKVNGVTVQTGEVDGMPLFYKQPPSDTAIIFFLKTKAKKRGYVERQEWTPVDPEGNALVLPQITVNVVKPPEIPPISGSE